jgi:putative intracellular protease/amidase
MTPAPLFRALLASAVLSLLGTALPVAAQTAAQAAPASTPAKVKTKKLAIVLFPRFETLDVFGPVEMWGRLDDYEIVTVSEHGGTVTSAQGIDTVTDYAFDDAPQFDIIMIPGGMGTRTEVNNPVMLDFLRKQDGGTEYTTSVCTGSAVLAKAGLLDGKKATSNKMAWAFVTSQDGDVLWQPSARWVEDGKYVTSSGISAGIDMALALIEDLEGRPKAENVARVAEYIWNDDPADDPFAVEVTEAN